MTSDLDPFQVQEHIEGFVAALRARLEIALLGWEGALLREASQEDVGENERQRRLGELLREIEHLRQHLVASYGEEVLSWLGMNGPLPTTASALRGFLDEGLRRVRLPDFELPPPPYDYLPGWSARGLESLFWRYQKQLASLGFSPSDVVRPNICSLLTEENRKEARTSTEDAGLFHTSEKIPTLALQETQEPAKVVAQLYWAAKHLHESLVCLSRCPALLPAFSVQIPTLF